MLVVPKSQKEINFLKSHDEMELLNFVRQNTVVKVVADNNTLGLQGDFGCMISRILLSSGERVSQHQLSLKADALAHQIVAVIKGYAKAVKVDDNAGTKKSLIQIYN